MRRSETFYQEEDGIRVPNELVPFPTTSKFIGGFQTLVVSSSAFKSDMATRTFQPDQKAEIRAWVLAPSLSLRGQKSIRRYR